MTYSRIDLSKTFYTELTNYKILISPDVDQLNLIYKKYCQYKKFMSVMPIFTSEYTDLFTDVIGYYDSNNLVAFSLIKKHDSINAECKQFAWDYENPRLRLGIRSLENECAIYKKLGFRYLYLGEAADYKSKFDGYELLKN